MPVTQFERPEKYRYQTGFGAYLETEAVAGALPVARNSPQKPAYGLYAEKLSGTAFTAPRAENLQSWLYRVMPACALSAFAKDDNSSKNKKGKSDLQYLPDQFRWDPFPMPTTPTDFVDAQRQVAGAGDATCKTGLGVFVYAANASMDARTAYYSSDGDLLVVPQAGALDIRTELGWLLVRPLEVCVLPRGVRYQVHLLDGTARGYCLELHEGHFRLPELGPIGSSGLASARDFQIPVAAFDDDDDDDTAPPYTIRTKMNGVWYRAQQTHSPFDVVAWHGTYYPYKYDLGRFNTIGSVSFDHPDPSIFTVLTAPSATPGVAVADFVVFPPRWLVGEDTFRPPWYHRNTMSEYMGLLTGAYDAKTAGAGGFVPGGASLHNTMSGHGPDGVSYIAARNADLVPSKVGAGSCAFMFETCLVLGVTADALDATDDHGTPVRQHAYVAHSWGDLPRFWQRPAGVPTNSHLCDV